MIDQKGLSGMISPSRQKEGLYEEQEGKNVNYEHRIAD